ncbi:MAG TPA: CO dehydrogenase/acetyl-CoA synthase complex subunit alpha [Methanospirillum sp.]|uniref:CO dehydrogenase/acetyl-CoA synthase complex subunit alpha n=1 Tax=Methanospirillum sp. TaxID=45200 RepID=UPI002D147315|nr:CO dehydrogenase/acetyl-CoA synthase complex subunit alpha [Methanospirillum sp.]HWQ64225.1 CO dehydrogenase/acetyl-CoA synthase complex subunit alpha [Methanospirillum sp.]
MTVNRKNVTLTLDDLKSSAASLKNLKVSIGSLRGDQWNEDEGPTPMPSHTDLRNWDRMLLSRYKPLYLPFCDLCCLCTYGKCDLSGGKKGACGIGMEAQQSRIVLLAACIGAATHISHARHLVTHLIKTYGRRHPLDIGGNSIETEAPIIRLVCGIKPTTLGDLEIVLDYCERQTTELLAATHTGQEGDAIDFESKVFHAGTMDHVGLEVADIAQISAFSFPKADPDASLIELGLGTVDGAKPVILVVGHNVPPAIGIIDYAREQNLSGTIEITGICCTAVDLTRYDSNAKIIGPISWQLRYIRSGVPDVIVVDEQCVRADLLIEAQQIYAPLIATSSMNCSGLPDRTGDEPEAIIDDLLSGKTPGVLILDPEKVGEVAVRTAIAVKERGRNFRTIPPIEDLFELAKRCRGCQECSRVCPASMPLAIAIQQAGDGDLSALASLYDSCIGCGKCEDVCFKEIPVHSAILSTAEKQIHAERFNVRAGRGAIQDIEIREVGGPIVLGEIPGVVAFVGCANYGNGAKEVAEMAREFARRRYIVVTSGCSAMAIGMHRNEDGQTPYEEFHGRFDAGGIVNVGSCVSNAHIAGATIKIASIFAKRSLRGNYEEIADYVYNRVGAVGIAWGAMSQKAAAIAAGFWRLGIPVIVGPHGSKYRRMLLGRKDKPEDWFVYDSRTGEKVQVGPVPEHLFIAAETPEEAMTLAAKLCMRPNDTSRGRSMKLTNYIDLYKRLYDQMPDDLNLFVRSQADIPITMKEQILPILEQKGYNEQPIPNPTMLKSQIRDVKE